MKTKLMEKIEMPSGISCTIEGKNLTAKKGSVEIKKNINLPGIKVKVEGNSVVFSCDEGNKNEYKIIKSYIAHLKNMFDGLENKFVYKLQACNVHFPMTLKVDGKRLVINNFLGEKTPRYADISPNVDVEVKGQNITVSSHDKDSAGHTVSAIEKATKVRNRDRRVFQDGIFLTEKPGRAA